MPTTKCVPCNNRVFKDDKAYQQHARSNAAHKARMEASAPKPSTSLADGSVSTHRNQGKSHRRPNHGANFTSPSKHESVGCILIIQLIDDTDTGILAFHRDSD